MENIRKIATMARNCGNIWISSSDSRPIRRPRNRRRLNAYAARADRNTDAADDAAAMTTELTNQPPNAVSANSRVKLPNDAPVGTSWVDESVPSGLSAADTTNRIGPSENTSASTPTACRHPTAFSHFTRRPLPVGGCG